VRVRRLRGHAMERNGPLPGQWPRCFSACSGHAELGSRGSRGRNRGAIFLGAPGVALGTLLRWTREEIRLKAPELPSSSQRNSYGLRLAPGGVRSMLGRRFIRHSLIAFVLSVLLFGGSAPAQRMMSLEFCRDVVDWSCVGPARQFADTIARVWLLARFTGAAGSQVTVEWIAPAGHVYQKQEGTLPSPREPAPGPVEYRVRFPLAVRGTRAEPLAGEWTVRVLLGNREIGSGTFGLVRTGGPKAWVEALGVVELERITAAAGVREGEPEGAGDAFALGQPVWCWALVRFRERDSDVGVARVWKWKAPSGETVESETRVTVRRGWSNYRTWGRAPLDRVASARGLWECELFVDSVKLGGAQFVVKE
jgi:hypothetical protein